MRLARTLYRAASGKPPQVKPFLPAEYGLKEDFVLTNYTKMKG
jgi:hypothetical protein